MIFCVPVAIKRAEEGLGKDLVELDRVECTLVLSLSLEGMLGLTETKRLSADKLRKVHLKKGNTKYKGGTIIILNRYK